MPHFSSASCVGRSAKRAPPSPSPPSRRRPPRYPPSRRRRRKGSPPLVLLIFIYSGLPFAGPARLDGITDWKLALTVQDHRGELVIESSLVGMSSSLPAP